MFQMFTWRSEVTVRGRGFIFHIRETLYLLSLIPQEYSFSFFFFYFIFPTVLFCGFILENLGKLAAFALFKVLVSWQKQNKKNKKLSYDVRNEYIPFTGRFLSGCMATTPYVCTLYVPAVLYVYFIQCYTCSFVFFKMPEARG